MAEIHVNQVFFSYTPGVPVLTDVNLVFQPGATAVIGQNGAGKTTLMKLLNGLLKPDSGTVEVNGVSTVNKDTADIACEVGLAFQNPDDQIFKHKVRDEVQFGPLNIGKSPQEAAELAEDALDTVGLRNMLEENPYDLSYADRKKICVASVLAMNTDIVVFDEPTISQDAHGLKLMGTIIRQLKAAGKTVIGIVHDMNFAAEYFDSLVVMAEGQVVAKGAVQDVFQDKQALQQAHVEPPAMGKLSNSVRLANFAVTVDDFVESYLRQTDRGRGR